MINMTLFCYALSFSMTAFAIVLLFLLSANTKLHENARRCRMEIESLNEAVQHLWKENAERKR